MSGSHVRMQADVALMSRCYDLQYLDAQFTATPVLDAQGVAYPLLSATLREPACQEHISNSTLEDGVFEAARDALVAGYREVRALPDDQLEKLPLFVLQRGFTYLGWCHTRRETATAQELAPAVVELVVGLTEEHLSR